MDMTRHLLSTRWDFVPLDEARTAWAEHRARHGLSADGKVPLLTAPSGNAKTDKTLRVVQIFVYGLALASSDLSGWNVCRFATRLCKMGCLSYAGHNDLPYARKAQVVKTLFLAENPGAFYTLLFHEIEKAERKHGRALRIRLNMLSDIPWELVLPELFERFPLVRFYDYTKWGTYSGDLRVTPPNYELTHSASERTSDERMLELVEGGARVAVVFGITPTEPMIDTFHGVHVADGDAHDNRWLNGAGEFIGLRAKGRMRRGEFDGFVKAVA